MSKLIFLKDLENIDFKEIGLVCGIEIHQQLNTNKLFCSCPCEIVSNDKLDKKIIRKLRFSLGESGNIDKAALEEFKKDKMNTYLYNSKIACLVDLDEEPPHKPNKKAIDTALAVGLMLNMSFFDKITFMRKLIIDGSITSGFQRTSQIAFSGQIKTTFGKVKIDAINIEEDSSRIIQRNKDNSIFSLDRQAIPLIEITTGPNMYKPEQAQEVAKQLGDILRSFNTIKRGIGTIRQDLNVSIKGASRVEIKGAQNLKLIPEIIIAEVKRQKILLSIQEEFKRRKINTQNFTDFQIYNVTKIFDKSNSRVIKEILQERSYSKIYESKDSYDAKKSQSKLLSSLEIISKKNSLNLINQNSKVLAIKLNNFKGLLGHNLQKDHRFATEISDKNKKTYPQIKGLFHSDELPKYGIEEEDITKIKKELKLIEGDSFILIVNQEGLAKKSLYNVFDIIKEYIDTCPSEVRQVDPKGTLSKYLRSMPGSARMYPETDVPEILISEEKLKEIKEILPEIFSNKISRLVKEFEIEENKLKETLELYSENEIRTLIKNSNKKAKELYLLLFEIPKDIKKREKIEPINFKISLLEDLLKIVKEKNLNQQAIRDIFLSLYKDKIEETNNIRAYLDKKGFSFESIDEKIIEKKIKKIKEENKSAPFGALMGLCMTEFKGKVDGKVISDILRSLQ